MSKFIKHFLLLSLFPSLIYYSCTNEDSTSSGYSCNQECQDQNIAYGVTYLFNSVWNQHLSYLTGNIDTIVNGPKGGSTHVTGYIEPYYPNTINLTYDMLDCKDSDENFNLVLNGGLHITGSVTSVDKSITLASVSELAYSGTVGKNANVPVNDTCQININATQYDLSGMICGRSFNYYNHNK